MTKTSSSDTGFQSDILDFENSKSKTIFGPHSAAKRHKMPFVSPLFGIEVILNVAW